MRKVRAFWLAAILLIAAALAARIYVIWPTLKPTLANQVQHTVNQIVPTPPRPRMRPDLATGMIFPQWGTEAYTPTDKNWVEGLKEIQTQTAARWVGLYIQFHQPSEFSTDVHGGPDTPTPEGLKAGVELARKMGSHVYVFPTITLDGAHAWAGYIRYADDTENQAWFDTYWQLLKPYAQVCQQAGCDRFSIGNELEGLERSPDVYWQQLISRVHSIYTGQLVYNMNFSSQLKYSVPSWMTNPLLTAIGVSSYYPLTDQEVAIPQNQLAALWKSRVQSHLDKLSTDLGKPVFISEIGYRDTNYAGYNPYQAIDHGRRDDQMQAALYNAALENIATDHKIDGVFIWAWSMQPFAPNYKPSAKILQQWFEKL